MNDPIIAHVDAFTTTPFAGNSAGVVLNADGMSDHLMQLIARELRHSETAFVLAPDGPDHDVRIRYFTPTVEVPICGHATVAAHAARSALLGAPVGIYVQKTAAGLQEIETSSSAAGFRVTLHQGRPSFEEPLPATIVERIKVALGLESGELSDGLPVQIVSTGHSKVMVPLNSTSHRLNNLVPNQAALTALSEEIGCNGYFPFRLEGNGSRSEGRMFAPAIGISEDPVTGNANGPLGAYLVRHGILRGGGQVRLDGQQGAAMGRPGIVHVTVDHDPDGTPTHVQISGDAIILFSAPFLHAGSTN